MIGNWKYYNHALIPSVEPHKSCMPPNNRRSFWKNGEGGIALLARWTTDFDCGYETSWWYVIKDSPFDISMLKAKRRYEINKGKRNFTVKRINALEYEQELLSVQIAALKSWPKKYRPVVNAEQFVNALKTWDKAVIYGGFNNETGELCGYSYLEEYPEHLEFNILRVRPESEKKAINAAMIAAIVEDYNSKLGNNFYINDGSRAIRHETAFQDYLEKYFGFRKAYCKLNLMYRFPFGILIYVLYPFRKKIKKESRVGSLLSGLLFMEEIARECN